MSEVGRWSDSRCEETVVIEYKTSSRSITSPMSQIDTPSVNWGNDLLFPEITRLRSTELDFLDLTCSISFPSVVFREFSCLCFCNTLMFGVVLRPV